ncbi:hypothetical protein L3Q72_09405 [Vibrio sp. JC009]|uniref:hypothetical protein n=1 Tax=Vibrio sp. JC009 TaxID=2912314 RepID=UPI0023B065A1|nr:hypothetical protein [Vibrio sp. JC009]WED20859.1 hypothetical protein L3Q72_09405 [Vibrio sp. JC009]
MLRSVVQFIMTLMLVVVCAHALNMSEGDIPILAFMIPVVWIIPQSGPAGILLLASICLYGFTLPYQPVALSISTWILIPVLMVAFCSKSNRFVRILLALCVLAMESGIMLTQVNGKLEGSAGATLIQLIAVAMIWYSTMNWKLPTKHQHSWWSLLFIFPLWLAGWWEAALLAIGVTGIMAATESLKEIKSFKWHRLLYWSLPTVGFSAFMMLPNAEVPSQVLAAWLFLLGTAWATEYLLYSEPLDEDNY